ncbi:hypothetical protein V1278_003206 [Bradyrhizobium sp. AZCC 1577]
MFATPEQFRQLERGAQLVLAPAGVRRRALRAQVGEPGSERASDRCGSGNGADAECGALKVRVAASCHDLLFLLVRRTQYVPRLYYTGTCVNYRSNESFGLQGFGFSPPEAQMTENGLNYRVVQAYQR